MTEYRVEIGFQAQADSDGHRAVYRRNTRGTPNGGNPLSAFKTGDHESV